MDQVERTDQVDFAISSYGQLVDVSWQLNLTQTLTLTLTPTQTVVIHQASLIWYHILTLSVGHHLIRQ